MPPEPPVPGLPVACPRLLRPAGLSYRVENGRRLGCRGAKAKRFVPKIDPVCVRKLYIRDTIAAQPLKCFPVAQRRGHVRSVEVTFARDRRFVFDVSVRIREPVLPLPLFFRDERKVLAR